MCGSKKPKKPKPTAADYAQVEQAEFDLQHFQNNFIPLEIDAINEASTANRDTEAATLKGRANADVMQEASQLEAGQGANLRNGNASFASTVGRNTDAISTAGAAASHDAFNQAEDRFTGKRLNVIQTGRDMARTADSGLRVSTGIATSRAIAGLRAERAREAGVAAGVSSALGGAMDGLSLRAMNPGKADPWKPKSPNYRGDPSAAAPINPWGLQPGQRLA